jgi:hypothetical protein
MFLVEVSIDVVYPTTAKHIAKATAKANAHDK